MYWIRNGYITIIGFFRSIVPYLGLGIIDLSLEDVEGWASCLAGLCLWVYEIVGVTLRVG